MGNSGHEPLPFMQIVAMQNMLEGAFFMHKKYWIYPMHISATCKFLFFSFYYTPPVKSPAAIATLRYAPLGDKGRPL